MTALPSNQPASAAGVDVLAVLGERIAVDRAGMIRPDALVTVRAAVFELIEALKLAESTIAESLRASGYETGSNVEAWVPEVRAQVAALVPIRAALARVSGGAK